MAHLVHITPENRLKAILRSGIEPRRWWPDPERHPDIDRVVWTFPVLPSHTMTLSWARELKRSGATTLAAVTIRLDDHETVYARHYNDVPVPMPLGKAIGIVRAQSDPRGFEVMIPRRVKPSEIVRSRILTKVFGWRYGSTLKGRSPMLCDCPMCLPVGEVKAARQRSRLFERMIAEGREPESRRYRRGG